VLGLEIHLFDKEGSTAEDRLAIVDRCRVRLQGYVDIQWSITSAPRKTYTTRFLVPDVENPTFDVVLSQQSVQEYGLAKSNSLKRG
jgi:murein tripeptide amidase MpaA